MRILKVMLSKEWTENVRTYKVISLIIVLMIMGIMSPFTAIIMPDIIKGALPEEMKDMFIPKPTYIDAYIQFFKNVNQIGLIVLVIMYSGMLVNELNKGTLMNLVTKGLSRKYIIISKWIMSVMVWSIAYVIGAFVHYGYTLYYFSSEGHNKILAYLMTWLFGVMLLSLILLFSTLLKNNIGIMLGIIVVIICLFIGNMKKRFSEISPLYLIQNNTQLMLNKIEILDVVYPAVSAITVVMLSIILSIYRFNKIEIKN
ncbi:ABC transporter permease [Macrococcus capreoli]|uniref:ABC transporter permease n=1 Tax=Macrococcus capreoli TaxID=2982690 RepID=UPI0021D5C4D2|nr:ABC transporter permease [Macrococcus sp. TMW 2.2395]MCU7557686.1 ABC transporter permease [Macrococcus sp. TMW 2.2395]